LTGTADLIEASGDSESDCILPEKKTALSRAAAAIEID
jgi:hypothetical protein